MKKTLLALSKKHPKLYEISKFIIVGGCATIIDMLSMAIFLYIVNPSIYNYNFFNTLIGSADPDTIFTVIGTGIGFIVGLIFNYIFSIIFVFCDSNTEFAKTKTGFIVFASLSFIGFLIHTIGMAIGYGLLQINEWIIKIFLTFIVLIFNYITRKKIIFK